MRSPAMIYIITSPLPYDKMVQIGTVPVADSQILRGKRRQGASRIFDAFLEVAFSLLLILYSIVPSNPMRNETPRTVTSNDRTSPESPRNLYSPNDKFPDEFPRELPRDGASDSPSPHFSEFPRLPKLSRDFPGVSTSCRWIRCGPNSPDFARSRTVRFLVPFPRDCDIPAGRRDRRLFPRGWKIRVRCEEGRFPRS